MITLVSPHVEILDNSNYIRSMVFAGRITHGCEEKYVSEEDDASYVKRMESLGHGRVFEFGTIYLTITKDSLSREKDILFFSTNRYSRVNQVTYEKGITYYVTTNYRVLLQGRSKNWKTAIRTNYKDNLLYLLNDDTVLKGRTENHIPRITVWWKNISRVTADSFRTHTMLSSLMQSTRYCNYGNERFGNNVKITRSVMWEEENGTYDISYTRSDILNLPVSKAYKKYLLSVHDAGNTYTKLTTGKYGIKIRPECARGTLPLDTATSFVQCGFVEDWDDFFRQRINEPGAHPDARFITGKLKDIFPEPVE